MGGCLFCDSYEKGDFFFENKEWYARFDLVPVAPGHSEIIPKRHVESLFALTMKEWKSLKIALHDVKNILQATKYEGMYKDWVENPPYEKTPAYAQKMLEMPWLGDITDDFNIGINEGHAAGRTIDHLHIHVIPRHLGDVEDYVGGVRHIIPGMGNYKK